MLAEMDRVPLLERSLQIPGIVRPTEHLPRGNRTIPCCPGLARVMGSPFLRFLRRRIGERLPTEDRSSFGIDLSVGAEMSVQKAEGTRLACQRKTFPHQSTRKAASPASLELWHELCANKGIFCAKSESNRLVGLSNVRIGEEGEKWKFGTRGSIFFKLDFGAFMLWATRPRA